MNRFKFHFSLFVVMLCSDMVFGQSIQWLSFEQAAAKAQVEKRKVFVDVYTDWCGWCKHMDRTTFEDSLVIREMGKHWYAVKFNAETRKDIVLNGKTYKFVPNDKGGGYHELAKELLQGQMSYPTVVFMNESFQSIQAIPGYRDAYSLEMILTYFGGNYHQKVPWSKFERDFALKKNVNPNAPTVGNKR